MDQNKKARMILVSIFIALFIGLLALSLWYVPYEISHDQHMVDTINVRALDYEHPEGVITDFTEAEIMRLDAQEGYENKVWKLDHQELYWYAGIVRGILISLAIVLLLYVCRGGIIDVIFDDEDEDDDDDIDFEFEDDDDDIDFEFEDDAEEPAEPEKEVEEVPVPEEVVEP